MAYTQDDLDRIDQAIASGELSVRIGDKHVTYRSIEELKSARAFVARQLDAQAYPGRRPVPRHQLASFADE